MGGMVAMAGRSLWAGLDTGADTSRLCVIDEALAPVLDTTIASAPDAILDALVPLGSAHIVEIAVEASDCAIPLARGLRDTGYRVILYEARQVSRYLRIRRNKTDDNDARGLAELAKLQLPSMRPVYLKSPDTQRLRAKLQFRQKLLRQRVTCENMIRALIRLHGGKVKSGRVAWTVERNVRAGLDALRSQSGIDLSDDILPLLSLTMAIRQFVERLDKEFLTIARAHPVCSRFLRIGGVGPICAISFYTAIEDPFRFVRAADIGPYLGLTPRILQSGTSLRHGRISKFGNLLTRSHLVLAATVAMQGETDGTPLKTWALALADRAGRGKARVALARRLAVIMLAMWKSGTAFDAMLPSPRAGA